MSRLKIIIFVITLIPLFVFFFLNFIVHIPYVTGNLTSLFYWIELLLVVEMLYFFKVKALRMLQIAFGFFILGAIFNLLNKVDISETILRVGFVIWVAGLVFYAKKNKFSN